MGFDGSDWDGSGSGFGVDSGWVWGGFGQDLCQRGLGTGFQGWTFSKGARVEGWIPVGFGEYFRGNRFSGIRFGGSSGCGFPRSGVFRGKERGGGGFCSEGVQCWSLGLQKEASQPFGGLWAQLVEPHPSTHTLPPQGLILIEGSTTAQPREIFGALLETEVPRRGDNRSRGNPMFRATWAMCLCTPLPSPGDAPEHPGGQSCFPRGTLEGQCPPQQLFRTQP